MQTKKFTSLYLTLLICCLIISACGSIQTVSMKPEQSSLVAILEFPDKLPVHEPVIVKFTLQNNSDKAIYFLKWYTPLEGISGEIFRVERDGQLLPYEGILAKRAAPMPESYIHLDPGESVSAEVDLSSAYDFSQPGEYTIAFLSPRISHIAYSEKEMASSVDELHPVNISSKEVSVKIVKNSSSDTPYSLSAQQALVMIEGYLRGQNPDLTNDPNLVLMELTSEDIWKSLRVQIFRVTEGNAYLNESFLISEDRVLSLGTAVGGRSVTSMLLSDLDQDGLDELLFTFSFDSGTYQSRIGIYAPGVSENQTFEADIAYLGDLGLLMQEDGNVSFRDVDVDEATSSLKYQEFQSHLTLEKRENGAALEFLFNDDLPDDVKNKIIRVQITSDCQFLDRVQLDIEETIDSTPEEIVVNLWTQYLEQFQSPLLLDRCKLTSFTIDNITINPNEGQLISVEPDEYIALVEYAVQVENKEKTIWIAGSGRDIEFSDNGWIGKTALVTVTKKDKVCTLTIQGFG